MHDIWNPWHGCVRCSEGCANCYMYYLDRMKNGRDGGEIYKTASMNYPLIRDRRGAYKIKSGEMLRVCMTSDFFLEEADAWREEAWDVMRTRRDVIFFLLTKRPERVTGCLPDDWGDGWENVFFNVSAENQRRADERIPLLLDLPFRHKGVMCAPFIGEVSLENYLKSGVIEQVICGGENYGGARPCHFDWVKRLYAECATADVTFSFIETGTFFIKDGKTYRMPDKNLQSRMAYKSGMQYKGRPIHFHLTDAMGFEIPEEIRYKSVFRRQCGECGNRITCAGCHDCRKCTKL